MSGESIEALNKKKILDAKSGGSNPPGLPNVQSSSLNPPADSNEPYMVDAKGNLVMQEPDLGPDEKALLDAKEPELPTLPELPTSPAKRAAIYGGAGLGAAGLLQQALTPGALPNSINSVAGRGTAISNLGEGIISHAAPLAYGAGAIKSATMDPRWADVQSSAAQGQAGMPRAGNTAGQVVGQAALMGQMLNDPMAKTIAQTAGSSAGGLAEGLGQGIHSVGSRIGDITGGIAKGISSGLKDMTSSPEESQRRQLVEQAMGMTQQHQKETDEAPLIVAANTLKEEMAKPNPDFELIRTLTQQLQTTPKGGGILESIFGTLGNVGKGIGSAITSGNPLSVVGNTLNAVAPEMTSNPNSLLSILKEGLSYGQLAPGLDTVSKALGLGSLYPKSGQQGGQGGSQQAQPKNRDNYFNEFTGGSQGEQGQSITAQQQAQAMGDFDRQEMQIRPMLNNPSTRTSALEQLSKIQDLRNKQLTNYSQQQGIVKTGRERSGDYGIYVQGSDEHKYMDSISQGIKNYNTLASKLDEDLTRGDYRSAVATMESLAQQMKKVTQQDVPEELKAKMAPLIQKFEGMFGMFKGDVVNARNIPVMWQSAKSIKDEMDTTIESFFERPGNNVDDKTKKFLLGNEITSSKKEKSWAPAIPSGEADNAFSGGKLALAVGVDGHNVGIDSKGAPHMIDEKNKATKLIAMESGKPAVWSGDTLMYTDGSPVPNSDSFAHYAYHSAPRSTVDPKNKKSQDEFGFPLIDKNKSIEVPKLSGSTDSFNILYNKWTNPDFAENNTPYWTQAQENINVRNAQDSATELKQKGEIIGAQVPAAVAGIKAVANAALGGGGHYEPPSKAPGSGKKSKIKPRK